MKNSAPLNVDSRATSAEGRTRLPPGGDVAGLIRDSCRALGNGLGRHGFRVAAAGLKGRIFFDGGRVVHAEFGEDFGLRAIVEMLRAEAEVMGVWTGTWPHPSSVHFGPEVLALVADSEPAPEVPRVDTRVIRRVQVRSEPLPLRDPVGPRPVAVPRQTPAEVTHGKEDEAAGRVRRATPASSVWLRGAPRTQALSDRVAETLAQRPRPPRSNESARRGPAASAAPARSGPPVVSAAPARSAPPVEPAAARALRSGQVGDASPEVPARRGDSVRPSLVRRTLAVQAPVAGRGERARAESRPLPPAASADLEDQPTTMVRVSPRGAILAARGKHAEQLADAAAYIHGLANLIAGDLGRHGRAVVHIRGGGSSMLVLRSEVNDIAAAFGPTRRMASLLEKAGMR